MKNLKILLVLAFFTGLTYWGIEPYAHSVMHPHHEAPDYGFSDLERKAGAGDAALGKELVLTNCVTCHSVKNDNIPKPVTKEELETQFGVKSNVDLNYEKLSNIYLSEMYGVVPLDLSNVGGIYEENFLAAFIKNPANASFESTYIMHKKEELAHAREKAEKEYAGDVETLNRVKDALLGGYEKAVESYKAKNKIAMPGFDYLSDEDISHIVAYLQSIAHDLDGKAATELACGRCHDVSYDKFTAHSPKPLLKKYLGTTPPDLSMMIKSKGHEYLHAFVNDPQKVLLGSSMPRVGINQETETKVVAYLEHVGDPKKEERQNMGIYFIIYFLIFTVFAWLWKQYEYNKIH